MTPGGSPATRWPRRPREAFFAGKTGIEGDLETALAVIPVLERFFEEYPYDGPGV